MLLSKRADTTVKNKAGLTPIMLAANKGHADIGKLLLSKMSKAEKDVFAKKLLEACTKSDWKKAKTLLSCGVGTEAKDSNGETPLFKTVANGGKDAMGVMKLLIQKGANKDVTAKNGNGLLHCAATKGKVDVVKQLVEKKVALLKNEAEVLGKELLEDGVKWSVVDEARVQAYLIAGARMDLKNANNETMLMDAASKGAKDFVRLLLEHKADPQAKGGNLNTTALYVAARSKRPELAAIIVEAGGGTKALDPEGEDEWQSLLKSKGMVHVKQGTTWVLKKG